jgi:hypothetical protein
MAIAIQRRERERLAAAPLAGGQSAAAVWELAEGEGGGGDATDGQFSAAVWPLKRATRIAAITSSISVSRLVPAASTRIAFEQTGC